MDVQTKPDGVSFRPPSRRAIRHFVCYKKTLKLETDQPVLIVQHELRNTGTETIETDVYNHDFFVIVSRHPTGARIGSSDSPLSPKPNQSMANGASNSRQRNCLWAGVTNREIAASL